MNAKPKVKVAIVGANGYSGEELCAILARHPSVDVVAITSRQHAGKAAGDVLPRLAGVGAFSRLVFCEPSMDALLSSGAEYFFLALPHGLASEFALPLCKAGKRVIDLSADFRLRDAAVYQEFYGEAHPAPEALQTAVYGLPELHRSDIGTAQLVASAGCYPTSILLPLVPLLKQKLIQEFDIIVSSASGVSGAGRKADTSLLFGECNESLRAYGLPKHWSLPTKRNPLFAFPKIFPIPKMSREQISVIFPVGLMIGPVGSSCSLRRTILSKAQPVRLCRISTLWPVSTRRPV